MEAQSKFNAQVRADQIRSFQAELALLEREKIVSLSEAQQTALANYHTGLIASLASRFDIDASQPEKQLSLGMKVNSFLGALGLAAAVFFLFYQFWGRFSTSAQIIVLLAAPLLGLAATMYATHKETTGYFAKLFGMVALACFVLNLSMFGQIFNIAPSENVFFVWAAFAFALAYASDSRFLLAAGIAFSAAWLSAKTGTWGGCYWLDFGERPENFFPVALLLFCISFFAHNSFSGFRVIYRGFSLLLFFIPVLILSNWGMISYLPFPHQLIEILYQIAGFVFSALAVWIGIRKNWSDVMNSGNVFFTIFLYTKFFDWWWDWMPKYMFFFLIGLTAILLLFVLKFFKNSILGHESRI